MPVGIGAIGFDEDWSPDVFDSFVESWRGWSSALRFKPLSSRGLRSAEGLGRGTRAISDLTVAREFVELGVGSVDFLLDSGCGDPSVPIDERIEFSRLMAAVLSYDCALGVTVGGWWIEMVSLSR